MLASPNAIFIPVHSLIRSKISSAAILCLEVAERVLFMVLMGHKRKYPPIPWQLRVPGRFSNRLPSLSILPSDWGTVDSTSSASPLIAVMDVSSNEHKTGRMLAFSPEHIL